MNTSKVIIKCHIAGIIDFPYPSIPDESRNDIVNGTAAIRVLLSAHGGYTINEIPQFCSGGVLLTVVANDAGMPPFNSAQFDLYVRNVAEFIDATNQARHPILTHDEHGVDIHDIEDVCRSLKGFGKVVLQIGEMETITLFNRPNRHKNDRNRNITIEVASTEAVAGLTHDNGMLVVPDAMAALLHPGDSIDPEITKSAKPIRRSIGSLIEIIDDTGSVTSDMFSADDDSE